MLVCVFSVFFGLIFEVFQVWGGSLPDANRSHGVLYKPQNMPDKILNFFLFIINQGFRTFGAFFMEKYFFGNI